MTQLTYEEAEKLALQAIHDVDGRGMVGRGRNHLHQRVARALLSAARTQSQGDGWVLVPRVPTVEMLVAATEEWLCVRSQEDRAEFIWDAMLAAAPSPGGDHG